LGDVGVAVEVEGADGEVAEGGHGSWSVEVVGLVGVFLEGDVADVVEFVFYFPLSAYEGG
jgi:hypothetical protein